MAKATTKTPADTSATTPQEILDKAASLRAEEGKIVLKEQAGLRVVVDLTKQDKSDAITALEEVLSQLKE